MNNWVPVLVTVLTILAQCQAYKFFQQQIPNGEVVPHPCKANFLWRGVGHENLNGGGTRNAFGLDFKANGMVWNAAICMMDSDGDGRTNGEELGDPDCTWTPGMAPKYSAGLSHPGICEPVDDRKCAGKTDFVDCSSEGFTCGGINETGTFAHEVRFPVTDVPAVETTYMCMLFEFPSQDDFHIVATTPYLDNEDIMHHIIIYGCDPESSVSNPLNQPYPSNMRCDAACGDIIGLWTVGINGYCMQSDVGFKVGASGYRTAAIEMHWNNPLLRADYTDSSGMTFYLTPNIRPYEAGVLMIGQNFLEIPPGQYAYSTDGGCPGSCTSSLMQGPLYIMEAFNHMHYLGAAQRTRLVKNNVSLDLAWDEVYSYDSPVIHTYEDPIRMDPGDDLVTTCTFQSTSRTVTTYFGESTSAEMCFAFLIYYPKENLRTTVCSSTLSASPCDFYSGVVQGCDIQKLNDPTDPEMLALYGQIWENCAIGTCKAECLPIVRDVKKHPCFSGDVTKFFRSAIEGRHSYSKDPAELIFYAKMDSCDGQLAREQCPTCRGDGNGMVDGAAELRMGFVVVLTVLLGKYIV